MQARTAAHDTELVRSREVGPPRAGMSVTVMCVIAATVPIARAFPGGYERWILLVLAALAALALTRHVAWHSRIGPASVAFSYLIVCGALSSATNALNLTGHVNQVIQLLVVFGVSLPVISWFVRERAPFFGRIAAAFAITQTVSGTVALAQTAGFSGAGALEFGRASGLAGHPNVLGIFSGVAILIWAGSLHGRRATRRRRLLIVIAILVNVAALVASGSTSSMLSFAIGLLVYLYIRRTSFARLLLLATALAVGAIATDAIATATGLFVSPFARVQSVTGATDNTGTLGIRLDTISYAISRILDDPFFGAGLDDASGLLNGSGPVTHNLLARGWFQGGFFLGLAFIVIVVWMVFSVIRAMRNRAHAVASAVVVSMLVFSMTSAMLAQGYYWLPTLLAWLVLVGPSSPRTPPLERRSTTMSEPASVVTAR